MKKRLTGLLGLLALMLALLSACGVGQRETGNRTEEAASGNTDSARNESLGTVPATRRESVVGYQLDTVITLSGYCDRSILEEGLAECARYERLLSRTIEGSDVWRINHAEGAPVEVDPVTAEVIRTGLEISEITEGAFDITIGPAVVLWNFRDPDSPLPSAKALEEAAGRISWRRVELNGNTVRLPAGMMMDLGGIAKGYIADAVCAFLRGKGVESAILSFGGNIITIGGKPDGSPWTVGIQDIDRPTGNIMLAVESRDSSTVTSGTYERCFERDGVRYHHLLDPASGWPVQNGLASVTILTSSSARADALSTAVFILGEEKGLALIDALQNTEAVLIREDRTIVPSAGAGSLILR